MAKKVKCIIVKYSKIVYLFQITLNEFILINVHKNTLPIYLAVIIF